MDRLLCHLMATQHSAFNLFVVFVADNKKPLAGLLYLIQHITQLGLQMLQPDTKSADIIERINSFATDWAGEDLVLLKRLKAEAKKLLSSNVILAYIALGAIATIKTKTKEAMSCFEKAIKLAPNDPDVLCNYAVFLLKLNSFSKSIEYAEKAYKISGYSNPRTLDVIVKAFLGLGSFDMSIQWFDTLKEKFPEWPFLIIRENILIARKILLENKIAQDDFSRFLYLAYSVLEQNNFGTKKISFRVFDGEIVYKLHIYADLDQTVDLNFKLAEILVENGLIPTVSRVATVIYTQ